MKSLLSWKGVKTLAYWSQKKVKENTRKPDSFKCKFYYCCSEKQFHSNNRLYSFVIGCHSLRSPNTRKQSQKPEVICNKRSRLWKCLLDSLEPTRKVRAEAVGSSTHEGELTSKQLTGHTYTSHLILCPYPNKFHRKYSATR